MAAEDLRAGDDVLSRPVDSGLLEMVPIILSREEVDGVGYYVMSCEKGLVESRDARHFIEGFLVEFIPDEVDCEFRKNILPAFGEAATNALFYCTNGQCQHPFVACGILEDRLVVVIANSCRDYVRRPAEEHEERGRGLTIIFRIVEDFKKRMSLTQIVPGEGCNDHFVLAFTVYRENLS